MLASEIITRYEAYCPQELSMEGDFSGLQIGTLDKDCLLYTSPSPRDRQKSRMPSSA